jgi:methionine synthase II (cobalamin-independent)
MRFARQFAGGILSSPVIQRAVRCFQLAVSETTMETQIHTHMCYSNFSDVIHAIEKMDADVVTIIRRNLQEGLKGLIL